LYAFDDDNGIIYHQADASTSPNIEKVLMEKPNSGKRVNVPTSETARQAWGSG